MVETGLSTFFGLRVDWIHRLRRNPDLGQLKASWDSVPGFNRPLISKSWSKLPFVWDKAAPTGNGAGAVSSHLQVFISPHEFSDFSESNVLVVGAGETGRLVTQHLMAHQPKSLTVVNRSIESAQCWSVVWRQALGLDKLQEALAVLILWPAPHRSKSPDR